MIDRDKHRPAQRPAPEPEAAGDDTIIAQMFRRSLVAIAGAVVLGGLGFWLTRKPPEKPVDRQTELKPADLRKTEVQLPQVPFVDMTSAAGIAFVHENGSTGDKLLPESMGGGCAVLDYNNDNRPDILLVNSRPWTDQTSPGGRSTVTTLYRNDGNWKFTDVSQEAGVAVQFYGQGVAVGDYDNDGWTDVFLSGLGANHLLHNEQGKFVDVTVAAGVGGEETAWSTSSGFFDYDRDGDLDLFVANYVRWSPAIDRELRCTLDGSVRAYCRPQAFDGAFPHLYRNDGGGKFTDVSAEAGVQVKNAATGVPVGKSLGVVFLDADGDGLLDIVIANDTVQNFLFHNLGNGKFEEIGIERGIGVDNTGNARGAMGCDQGWFRNDDTQAVVIGNFANEMTALYCTRKNNMTFSDDAVATGLGPPSRIWLKFGVFFADLDLDSRLDLLVANGHLENDISKVQKSQSYEQPPQLYWNTGSPRGSEFTKLETAQTGADFAKPMVGRGATCADFDGDGDLDLLLTATGAAPRLLKNDQELGRHWLRVRLVGDGRTTNRDGIGAVVSLTSNGATQKRLISPTRSYLSQFEKVATFGLGETTEIPTVEVLWPNGKSQQVAINGIDREVTVEQTGS
jgi:hypothetical protein